MSIPRSLLRGSSLLLGFAIVSGIAITNYDVIKKLKWVGLEVETEKAKKDINTFANSKLEEINTEINKQKESINHLILDANNTRGKLEEQKQAAVSSLFCKFSSGLYSQRFS